MDFVNARHIIEALADGLDPASGEAIQPGSPLESAEVRGAFQIALDALDYAIKKQERVAALPAKAGQPWLPPDDRALSEAFDSGQTISQMAERFGRTEGSIASRLVRIGKAPDRDTARAANRR